MSLFHVKTDVNLLLSETFYEQRKLAQAKRIDYTLTLPRINLTTVINSDTFRAVFTELIQQALEQAESQVVVELLPFRSDDWHFHIAVRTDGKSKWPPSITKKFAQQSDSDEQQAYSTSTQDTSGWSIPHRYQNYQAIASEEEDIQCLTIVIPIVAEGSGKTMLEDRHDSNWFKNDENKKEHDKPVLLLVANDMEIRAALIKILKADYRIQHAQHGKEALDLLTRQEIHLVITEIALPLMDGMSLCRHMKAKAFHSHIPVVFLVEQHATANKMQGLLSGADAYVEKPFSSNLLAAQIDNLLANRRIMQNYVSNTLRAYPKNIPQQTSHSDFMKRLQLVLYTHISDNELSIDELAKQMNMSRPTLFRKVKKYSDMTPNELIHITKLNKAAELLAQQRYNITQVANMVGYSGQSNFSRDFHKHFGTPPSIYSLGIDKRHDVA